MLVAEPPVKPAMMSLAVSTDPVPTPEEVIRDYDKRWFEPWSDRSVWEQVQDRWKQLSARRLSEEEQVNMLTMRVTL